MSTLEIKDLYAHVETKDGIKPILKGVNLTVNSGETHAIMGPNGSGKSTLAYTLAGHPKYVVESGQVLLDGEDILKMLAFGADAVLIGRPAAVAAVGGGAEGVKLNINHEQKINAIAEKVKVLCDQFPLYQGRLK